MPTMRDAFICHSEKDLSAALEIAGGLEAAGFSTWYYERDNVPGESYLIQVGRAIEASRCVVLLVSRNSLASNQVTSEVVRAYEARIPFVPLLLDVTHREVQERQQVWRQALVTSTSLPIPSLGIGSILPRIVLGLENLGIHPGGPDGPPESPHPKKEVVRRRRRLHWSWGIPLAVAAIAALVWIVTQRGPSRDTPVGLGELPARSDSIPAESDGTGGGARPEETVSQGVAEMRSAAAQPPDGTAGSTADGEAIVTEDSRRPSVPVREEEKVDVVVDIDDVTGAAAELLVRALREAGLRAVGPETPDSVWAEERRAIGSASARARGGVLARLGADAALLGSAQLVEAAEGYGLHAVRAEVRVEWIPADSTQPVLPWAAREKATRASRDEASRAALEAAVAELIRQMRDAGRLP